MRGILLASAALLAVCAPARADTLLDHVSGVTIDKAGQVDRFDGLVIGEDGRIVRVLHPGDLRPERPDHLIDGKGQVALPGMIDAHAHVMETGFAALTLDLSDTRSLAEAQAKIAAFVKDHPARSWILGRGWNQELWHLGRFPTAAELDAVVADRPVWLDRVDGHAGWANSRALALAGVSAATHDPAGGRIERIAGPAPRKGARAAGGRPAGVLVDNAKALVANAVPPPKPAERDLALIAAQQELLKRGVTAAADMGTSIEDWQTFRRAGDNGSLRIRIMSYGAGVDNAVLIGGSGPTPWLYGDHLRLDGVKLYVDGALGSRGAALKAPYSDAPGTSGLRITEDTKLKNLMVRAAQSDFQVAAHAIGDAGNAAMLSAIEDVAPAFPGDRRWRIEHAQIVDPADLPRFGKFGIIASMQPVHQTSDRLMAEARLGPNRLAGAYAWKSMLKVGAKLAFGSDAPVEIPDPWAGFAAAVSRQGPDGQPAGGWQPQEIIGASEALRAYTADAAYAGFAEGRFGRLVPGEHADFILIDRDPLRVDGAAIRGTKVAQVWIDGRLAWDAGTATRGKE